MFSRLVRRYIRFTVQLNYLWQLVYVFLLSFIKKEKSIPNNNFTNIYLGKKVFSCYVQEAGLNVSFVDIATLKIERLDNSLLILNNNDFSSELCFEVVSKIKKGSINLQICIWDFDNHHAADTSIRLLHLSDFYFSAHPHNFGVLRRLSLSFKGVLPASVIQWSKDFLLSSLQQMLSSPRSNELFGAHVYYPPFTYRNNVINKVSEVFPGVCFSDLNYHSRTIEDRFTEWCSYKIHFIAPVSDDLPIRLFDALITGGIPIVPLSLKSLLHSLSIDYFVVFYDEHDLDHLHIKVDEAISKFDRDGVDGMKKRINFTLENHHINSRINFLINFTR